MAEIPITRTSDANVVAAQSEILGIPWYRLSWSAIFAGLVTAIVLELVFSLLGLAIGLGAIDTGDTARSMGIGAAIWAVVTAIIALFIGGWVAGRVSGPRTSGNGALHGFVLWGLSTLVAVWLIASGVGALAGGAFGLASNVLSGTAAGVTQGATQVGAAAAARPSAAQRAAGRVDSAAQAMASQANSTVAAVSQQAGEVATSAASKASSGAWLALAAMVLTAAAAVSGAASGTRTPHEAATTRPGGF